MSEDFQCTRCDRSDIDRIERPPFPTELGARIRDEVCAACWEEWKQRQMLLINHYGLKPQEASAREFLYTNLRAYLFGEGEMTAEIPVGQEKPAG